MRVNIGMPVVRTDGRSVGRSVGHVITKFSGMGRFIYPWCSAGALRARSSAIRATSDCQCANIVPKDITLVMNDHSKRKELGFARLRVEHNGS